jgi:hypothetical protein
VQMAIVDLLREGRIQLEPGTELYRSSRVSIAVGSRVGWEAAVFDHFQAVSKAIAAKVRRGRESRAADVIGGATLSFDVHDGHPLEHEVYGLLGRVRADLNELWARVSRHNTEHPVDPDRKIKVTFYMGQNVERPDAEPSEANEERER